MQKQFSLGKTVVWVVLLAFSVTLMPVPVTAADGSTAAGTSQLRATGADMQDFYPLTSLAARYDSKQQAGNIVVAQNTATGASQETTAPAEAQQKQSCCGDFWDVHFGGYRWAWWALAGAGLIAIHAN